MSAQLRLGDVAVDVVFKDIKNVHLSVHPPTGRVRISAPVRMNLDTIRVFAISKLSWIKQQQQKFLEQERETPREYLDLESHYVQGRRYRLSVVEASGKQGVYVRSSSTLELRVRPGSDASRREAVLARWHRELLREEIPKLIAKWEPLIGVTVNDWGIKKMRTRWGTCNAQAGRIWLNLELAKKQPECLEYIVVHEMVHLIEPHHNDNFRALMDQLIPQWRLYRDLLNQAPLGHESWDY